jgi:glycosyltransferase involved in cell wall biosynthesis
MALHGKVLIIVENLPVPFDRRVWQEATTLQKAGYTVSVICPIGKGFDARYELLEGIHIYRHPLPIEAKGWYGYVAEYVIALLWEFVLSWKVFRNHGFDVIHACNPPDNIFLIGGFFKQLFHKKFIFDHHDINPELYEAKFGRRDFFYRLMLIWESLTFRTADISIATNKSYRDIAIQRGGMDPDRVFVVRSGPNLERMCTLPAIEKYKQGKEYLVGYVGVIGQQEGIDYLLRIIHYIVYKQNIENIHFCIVGSGPVLDEMKKYAHELDIDEFVTFMGRVSDGILLEILNTADICVNSDVVNEMNDKSTMNKIMEYMALGKPIVQFDLTEGKFTARDASLYAAPNDEKDFAHKILELINNPSLRKAMGDAGRERVRTKLAWKYEAPKLLIAYEYLFKKIE